MKTSSFLTPVVNFLAKAESLLLIWSGTAVRHKNRATAGEKKAASAYI